MRKVKFRAWDKGSEKMVFQHEVNLVFKNEEYLFSLNEESVELLHYDEDYNAYVKCDAKIMQYTGIKDIDGKEIYEGDIVEKEFVDFSNIDRFKGIVRFIDGSWIVENEKKRSTYSLFSETDVNYVIGNVCENTELLDQVNNDKA